MARHEHAHEVLGFAIAVLARDQDVVDVLVVEVADGALDQRALLIDEGGGRRAQRQLAHALPHAHQVFVIPLDLGLGAGGARRAQDDAHSLGHLQLLGDFLQALAVGGVGDLARDAAAAPGIGHQDRIAAGEREIGGQGRALVAALFLDDLHQQDLPALDDFLDLVLLAVDAGTLPHLLESVAAELLDDFVLLDMVGLAVLVRVIVPLARRPPRRRGCPRSRAPRLRGPGSPRFAVVRLGLVAVVLIPEGTVEARKVSRGSSGVAAWRPSGPEVSSAWSVSCPSSS